MRDRWRARAAELAGARAVKPVAHGGLAFMRFIWTRHQTYRTLLPLAIVTEAAVIGTTAVVTAFAVGAASGLAIAAVAIAV
jgi:hypothetical protein